MTNTQSSYHILYTAHCTGTHPEPLLSSWRCVARTVLTGDSVYIFCWQRWHVSTQGKFAGYKLGVSLCKMIVRSKTLPVNSPHQSTQHRPDWGLNDCRVHLHENDPSLAGCNVCECCCLHETDESADIFSSRIPLAGPGELQTQMVQSHICRSDGNVIDTTTHNLSFSA